MNAKQILNCIPEDLLNSLSTEYNLDYQVKKLNSVSMFKQLLYSFLTTQENSNRVIEEIYHSISFDKVPDEVYPGVKYYSVCASESIF